VAILPIQIVGKNNNGCPWEKFAKSDQAAGPWSKFQTQEQAQPEQKAQLYNPDLTLGERAKMFGRNMAQDIAAGVEGAASLGDIIVSPITEPLRRAGFDTTPMAESVRQGAQALGVPEPSGPVERVATDVSKVLGPTVATMGAGGPLSLSENALAAGAGKTLASQPAQQFAAATAGGLSGSLAKESGQNAYVQLAASLAGGIAPTTLSKMAQGTISKFSTAANQAAEEILARNGIDLRDMPSIASRKELLDQVKQAVKSGGIDEAALKRYADYKAVGATPTKGRVTLNQIQLTNEKNLAKIGASGSHDKSLQALSNIEQENDALLTQRINEIGAEKSGDAITDAVTLMKSLRKIDKPIRKAVDKAYQSVRDSEGRYARLNTKFFSETANNYLDEQQLGSALPDRTRTLLNDLSSGKIPFNVNTIMQTDKRLSGQMSDALSGSNPNREAAKAIAQIRKALFETPVENAAGEQSLALYEKARKMAAGRFSIIDDTPALKAALDKAEPDKFVQTFIVGGGNKANLSDVKSLAKQLSKNPEAFDIAKNQIAKYLRDRATGGAADEVAKFSASNYNKALNQLGDAKLKLFFGKKGLQELKRIGRVASYEKFRPEGSAVNTSNTATTKIGRSADMTERALKFIPGGRYLSPLAGNALRGLSSGREAQLAMAPELSNRLQQKGGLEQLAAPLAGMISANQ